MCRGVYKNRKYFEHVMAYYTAQALICVCMYNVCASEDAEWIGHKGKFSVKMQTNVFFWECNSSLVSLNRVSCQNNATMTHMFQCRLPWLSKKSKKI